MKTDSLSYMETICVTEGGLLAPHRSLDKRGTRVHFSVAAFKGCAPHAARRNLTPADLIKLMVDRIVQDNLFEAILDDGK